MQFYKQNEDNIEMSFEIKNIEIVPGGQITGGNNSFVLSYNPIKEENINILSVNEENEETYFAFTRNAYNLQSLGWTWSDFELDGVAWDQNDMIDWINDGLRDSDIEGEYNNMTLSLNLPKIEIINPWSTTSDNKTESNP